MKPDEHFLVTSHSPSLPNSVWGRGTERGGSYGCGFWIADFGLAGELHTWCLVRSEASSRLHAHDLDLTLDRFALSAIRGSHRKWGVAEKNERVRKERVSVVFPHRL